MEDELCDLIEAPRLKWSLDQAEQPRNWNFQKRPVSVGETLTFTLLKGPLLFSSLLLVRKIYTPQIIAVSLCWSYSGFVIQ